jgi:hypothetical protein
MTGRDSQRARLYAWEEAFVAPRDPTRLGFSAAQGMVDAIWSDLRLRFPPKVRPLPRQARTTKADADRLTLRLPETFPSWHLLHELAHALSTTHDGESEGHGPVFVGLYVQLLASYLRLDRAEMLASLAVARISIESEAAPVFICPSGAGSPK